MDINLRFGISAKFRGPLYRRTRRGPEPCLQLVMSAMVRDKAMPAALSDGS
jgi:hypothetical protein